MSKRTERRAAERANHKLDYQQHHQPATVAASTISFANPGVSRAINAELHAAVEPSCSAQTPTHSDLEEIARLEAIATCVGQTIHAQINANGANAQYSSGPQSKATTAEQSSTGRPETTTSQNRRSHRPTGSFQLLPFEDMLEFEILTETVHAEYKPESGTEQRLADSLIRHYWLMQRALRLQDDLVLNAVEPSEVDSKRLALFLRYQTTHERSYYKAQKELQNLNKQKQKEQIGFESQQRQNDDLEAKTRLNNARALTLEVDANCRQVMEAPIPGTHNIPFETIAKACGEAIAVLAMTERQHAAGH